MASSVAIDVALIDMRRKEMPFVPRCFSFFGGFRAFDKCE